MAVTVGAKGKRQRQRQQPRLRRTCFVGTRYVLGSHLAAARANEVPCVAGRYKSLTRPERAARAGKARAGKVRGTMDGRLRQGGEGRQGEARQGGQGNWVMEGGVEGCKSALLGCGGCGGGRKERLRGGGGGRRGRVEREGKIFWLLFLFFLPCWDSAATSDRDGLDIGLRLVGALWTLQ